MSGVTFHCRPDMYLKKFKNPYEKSWNSLDKRAKFDLRSTKLHYVICEWSYMTKLMKEPKYTW